MFKITSKVKSFLGMTLLTSMAVTGWQVPAKAEQDSISRMIGSEEFLQMTADMMNSSLPMMIDEDTQWDSSYAGPGKMLTYSYTLMNYSASQIDGSIFANNIKSNLTNTICTTPATQIFPDNGVMLNFHYYDNSRNLIARVNLAPDDCK